MPRARHIAAIEAGFRKRKIQMEPTPQAFANAIAKHCPGYRLWCEETGEII